MPGTLGLVDGVDPDQSREADTRKKPAAAGAGRAEAGWVLMLLGEAVNALAVLAFRRFNLQPHFLAEGAGNKAAYAVGLPVRGFHNVLQTGSAGLFQQLQDLFGLAPLPGAGRLLCSLGALGGFSALFRRGGLLGRLGLGRRNVGLPWRAVGLRRGFRLRGSFGAGLGGLFFGRERRHRSFSSAVDYRGHDIHHSGAPEKQANCAVNRERRWTGDYSGSSSKLAAFCI